MVFPQKLDPDEFLRQYGMRGWQRLLDKYCYSRLDYLLLRTMERHDVNTASGKGDIVAAVSYTHLDVYKRQIKGRR